VALFKSVWMSGFLCAWLAAGVGAFERTPAQAFPAGSGGSNAPGQRGKPYLVLVSIDGYRWDFPDQFPTPAIGRLIREGQRAERLIPTWPTLTFPNHYTIVTGLSPAHHGLVANDFFDPERRRWYRMKDRRAVEDGSFYGGEPIWVTAETEGMVSAAFFWVGTEADVLGVRPTHWRHYDKTITCEERVGQVLTWLAGPDESRPHFYMLYFEDVDDNAHWHGPGSAEFVAALQRVDSCLARLLDGLGSLPHGDQVSLLLVSDHGQMKYHNAPPFVLARHISLDGLNVIEGGAYALAWQEQPDAAAARDIARQINAAWRHGRAYTPATAPVDWQVGNSPRMPHLIFQADPGYAVLSSDAMRSKITAGDHGWAPSAPEMHGVFIAWGPQVPAGFKGRALNARDIHAIVLEILQLAPPGHTGGLADRP